MQVHRIIARIAAVIGLTLAITVGFASAAGAQYDGGYEGYEGYEGTDDCPTGYEGYEGYEGCDDGTDPNAAPDETAAPPSGGGELGGSLPNTGGVAVLGLAGAAAVAGLALRRFARS